MLDHPSTVRKLRLGFTLVEMLVVLSIVVTMAAITVLFMPRIAERQRAASGAEQLQGWLLIARQWALRDRVPTGVWLQLDSTQDPSRYVRKLQYIQKPENFSQGLVINWANGPDPNPPNRRFRVDFSPGVDFRGASLSPELLADETSQIQAGDFLLLRGEGIPLPIVYGYYDPTAQTSVLYVTVANPIPTSPMNPFAPCTYQILRQPRLLAGEQPLQLPQDIAIDLNAFISGPLTGRPRSQNVPSRVVYSGDPFVGQPQSQEYLEILFSPSGSVVGQGSATQPIILWIRDVSKDVSAPGEQTLVAIYPTSGLIAAYPIAADATDPWKYARDGRSSGL
jgi:prepilin-type N-terminal cleavage/methylation domain-containing protein